MFAHFAIEQCSSCSLVGKIATMAKKKNQRIRMQTAAATFEFQFKLGKQRVREK